jgi:hypothetical protein
MRIAMIIALAATAVAGAAMAQAPAGGGGMDPAARFKAMDANSDGSITKDEWKGPAERFDAIDTNHDGKISAAELAAAPRGPRPAPAAQ